MKKSILNVIATIALALFAAPAMANYVLEQGPESWTWTGCTTYGKRKYA